MKKYIIPIVAGSIAVILFAVIIITTVIGSLSGNKIEKKEEQNTPRIKVSRVEHDTPEDIDNTDLPKVSEEKDAGDMLKKEPEENQGSKLSETEEPAEDHMGEADSGDSSWYGEKGYALTPQGEFKFLTTMGESDKDLGEVLIPGTVEISEERDGVPAGYKNVIAHIVLDCGNFDMKGKGPRSFVRAFDRSTGLDLDTKDDPDKDENGLGLIKGIDEDFRAGTEYEFFEEDEIKKLHCRIITTVPEDYEDTIFELCYATLETMNDYYEGDKVTERLDDISADKDNGYRYLFFSKDV